MTAPLTDIDLSDRSKLSDEFDELFITLVAKHLPRYDAMLAETKDPEVLRKALVSLLERALPKQQKKDQYANLPTINFVIEGVTNVRAEPAEIIDLPELVPTSEIAALADAFNADIDE